MTEQLSKRLQEAIEIKQAILSDTKLLEQIGQAIDELVFSYRHKGKALFCGNGGSAADAQHLAAELSGKFYLDRPPIQAEACHVNTSFLTAYSNDYDFEVAYARYIESVGRPGDVLIAISTSGTSANVVKAAQKARELGMRIIALTGSGGGELASIAHICLKVPSTNTPRIQEAHILIGHLICEQVEQALFAKQ
ncbi:D-sedoheptulose-7-phosphate isomerase [Sunxiuqinia elliptica]|uniref:Phosphoheptose isomerase n=1 Tax=Sunxiuqinia elliptica TaxID=655355 RepID=A0A1I2LCP2_9BACT|nr:SIS domain-containing protein [Sunxiuqinia elliptica]SFF76250.1 D-sedoheptulose 7-phosphate isomerase [Sunxiuqinia elliptica]